MRFTASQFNETRYDTYIDTVSSKQTELAKKLSELDIPSPENVKDSPSVTILYKWAVFLDLLLVLAVTRETRRGPYASPANRVGDKHGGFRDK